LRCPVGPMRLFKLSTVLSTRVADLPSMKPSRAKSGLGAAVVADTVAEVAAAVVTAVAVAAAADTAAVVAAVDMATATDRPLQARNTVALNYYTQRPASKISRAGRYRFAVNLKVLPWQWIAHGLA
jgi:hypothetical protein